MVYDIFINEDIKGLNAGIIGLGKIGSRVAELSKGLNMNVFYYNTTKKQTSFKQFELIELFEKSDVIFNTIATPPEIKGLITKELISKLNKKAVIVSTSNTTVFEDEHFRSSRKENLGGCLICFIN
jgi:lactate dehydrogenase-like 2-hydroxyacid dehydrogenase